MKKKFLITSLLISLALLTLGPIKTLAVGGGSDALPHTTIPAGQDFSTFTIGGKPVPTNPNGTPNFSGFTDQDLRSRWPELVNYLNNNSSNQNLTDADKNNVQRQFTSILQELKNRGNPAQSTNLNNVKTPSDDNTACFSITGGLNINTCAKKVVATIGMVLTWVFGLVLWVAGKAFDYSVYISVANFGGILNDSGTINTAWAVLRDLVNVVLIFVILYVAIRTVLNQEKGATKVLVNIIVVALLVNFSAFFTRIVIDASNVLANEFYTQINPPNSNTSIAGVFLGAKGLKLTDNFNPPAADSLEGTLAAQDKSGIGWGPLIVGVFGNVIMMLVASFVFFAAAVMFLTRTITLIILIVVSPLAFLAWAIPGLGGKNEEFWKNLLYQSFFAPFCLLFIWLTLKVAQNSTLGAVTNGAVGSGIGTGTAGAVIHYMIIIGLMIGSLMVAKAMGSTTAKSAMGLGKKWSDAGRGYILGGAKDRFMGRARLEAGKAAENLQTSNSIVARVARRIPLVSRTAGQIGSAARGGVSSKQKEVEALSLSDAALKNRAASAITTREERAAITNILASRGNLTPQGRFNPVLINRSLATQRGIAAVGNVKPAAALGWQYATNPTERAVAIQGAPAIPAGPGVTARPAIPSINPDAVEKIDLNNYFADPATVTATSAAAPGTPGHTQYLEQQAIRQAMYQRFQSAHVDKVMARPDDAADRFFNNFVHDFERTSYHTTAPAGAYRFSDVVEWLRAPQAGIPGVPNSGGMNNPRLAAWINSPAGQNLLRSYDGRFI